MVTVPPPEGSSKQVVLPGLFLEDWALLIKELMVLDLPVCVTISRMKFTSAAIVA